MSAKANNIKIGIFILAAVCLLIAGLLAFGARSYFTPKTKCETAIAGEVSGLSVGSPVQLRGVPIGKVTRIAFAWSIYPNSKSNLIVVEFEGDVDLVPLPPGMTMATAVKQAVEKGLRAMVKSQGITGTSILALENLSPNDYPPPPIDYTPRYYYIPSAPAQFTRMLEAIEDSLNHIRQLDIAGIGQEVTNALHSVTQLSDKLDRIDLEGLSTNAAGLLVNLRSASAKLQDAVAQVQTTIKSMKLDAVSRNANDLVLGVRDTNLKLQRILDHVSDAPVTQTVADLQQALQTLNAVLVDLKRYPSGFFLGEPPLPARSVQTPRQ
jgi:phospholipid/cholesterol/gamma-HCH transport system substrate-binding protein